MTATHLSYDRFATTRWSVVMHLAISSTSDAHGALTELVQRYWYPVYAYVRRCGHDPVIAQGIARSFLMHLLRSFQSGQALAERGHFRRFLLAQLNQFLASDWRQPVDEESPTDLLLPPVNLEPRYLSEKINATSPEKAYQRGFALEILARALKRLRSEAHKAGHLDMYEGLGPFLGSEPPPGVYEDLARKLQTRPLALVLALKRLRQRFRELIGEELADTVSSAEDLATEQAALHAILHETRTP
jgi:RNA polymerase sigma-70 factor (ECF subfamily)